MAVYKIFPSKDATLDSQNILANTGLDEIIELSTVVNNSIVYNKRPIIQFSQTEIDNVLNNIIQGDYKSYLKLFLANASNIPTSYTLQCFPVSGSWNMGTGRYSDSSSIENGVSWKYRTTSGSNAWSTSNFGLNVTASYSTISGGGTWYYTSLIGTSSQTFDYISSKDINFDVTNIINSFSSSSIENNGFIIKKEDSLEFDSNSPFSLSYFSTDTHTIYPPQLEFKWNDYIFNTGSSSQEIINDPDFKVTLNNNSGVFYTEDIFKFRINTRPTYPSRVFQTSSIYTNNYYLPTSSYYAVKDLDTDEFVIDFDNTYTKISADSTSNYFKIYMNGLEPERYYKILIKVNIDGQTIISDDNHYFKIVNG